MVEYLSETVPVAQLDRVLASEAEGCEFEPHRAHLTKDSRSFRTAVFFVLFCLFHPISLNSSEHLDAIPLGCGCVVFFHFAV